ncbi:MAG: hypothetical protein KatS3mg057_2511 [Herpetosiphonaceae bacterium]|nr:MAG: hypothetical protein KatS3mg057_2511 [Herpetosiphonaceae bacterium]
MIPRLRLFLGTTLALILLAIPILVLAQGTPNLSVDANPKSGIPGTNIIYNVTLRNTGSSDDRFDLTFANDLGWTVISSQSSPVFVAQDGSVSFQVTVSIPSTATPGTSSTTTVTARAQIAPNEQTTLLLITNVIAPTPTNTPVTPTSLPTTPTITPTPSATPVCADPYEPDNDPAAAKVIDIDIPQDRLICPAGDEDWLIFGGVAGKVYTIDIPTAADGIDPSLSLYDEAGNLLAFNDDYYLRNNDPTDVKPRIDSWRAPANGHYYIKVRDAATRGRVNGTYTIVLESESYGPTPTLIPELCLDLYEPDGVPEQARLMVVGEIQPDHRLCPTGDADWIKFFGKAGKTYTLVTSELTVGADTVMVLADRDGVSIIDFNDDFNNTLASRIVFTPSVDGFYYVQVKNIGDVGSQFIGYTLSLSVSVGGGPAPTQPPTPSPPPEETPEEATPEPTVENTPETTSTTPPYPITLSDKVPVANAPGGNFVDPAFAAIWQRSDGPVAGSVTRRSWMWGPQALVARAEVYDQSPGGLRQVQYFDKARMEITNYAGDRSSLWFVTNGLLVRELIEGRVQIGDVTYVNFTPAEIVIAGDLDDPHAPTYASFRDLPGPTGDRTGELVGETLNRQGEVGSYDGPARPETRLVTYIPETGHNIPQIFWDFFNQQGPISVDGAITHGPVVDWIFAMGYPISEPYWTHVRVGGTPRWVLVQAFERRVLTYTPDNPQGWRVEMGNVGLHYYYWRYGVLPR